MYVNFKQPLQYIRNKTKYYLPSLLCKRALNNNYDLTLKNKQKSTKTQTNQHSPLKTATSCIILTVWVVGCYQTDTKIKDVILPCC